MDCADHRRSADAAAASPIWYSVVLGFPSRVARRIGISVERSVCPDGIWAHHQATAKERITSGCTRTVAKRFSFDAPSFSGAGLAAGPRFRRRSVIRSVRQHYAHTLHGSRHHSRARCVRGSPHRQRHHGASEVVLVTVPTNGPSWRLSLTVLRDEPIRMMMRSLAAEVRKIGVGLRVLARREDFPDSAGVRPSSGAAA